MDSCTGHLQPNTGTAGTLQISVRTVGVAAPVEVDSCRLESSLLKDGEHGNVFRHHRDCCTTDRDCCTTHRIAVLLIGTVVLLTVVV